MRSAKEALLREALPRRGPGAPLGSVERPADSIILFPHLHEPSGVFAWKQSQEPIRCARSRSIARAWKLSFRLQAYKGVTSKVPACTSSRIRWGRSRLWSFLHHAETAAHYFEPDCAYLRQLVFRPPALITLAAQEALQTHLQAYVQQATFHKLAPTPSAKNGPTVWPPLLAAFD